ncbi:unnamed protein product [Microthlaspi erraticum]|uniref:F-box domain-containing protein n=1 Tax=Microthlaspi erraticum TaxID=1685480 RepID=A0A6D2KFV4_9BRAS|nr:unnamed protein product [Microthlaspi erraticum]
MRKTTTKPVLTPKPESKPNPSLPDDLLLSCIARVSRLYYPTLSLVSKSFRLLLASPELYKTRSLLGHTESCLYVCLGFPNPQWYTLCRTPNRTRKTNSSGNRLVPIPSPSSPLPTNLVAVGSSIYKIGGDVDSSCSVSVLDCRSHKWHDGLSMQVEGDNFSTASLVDGKIYVAGGYRDGSSVNWVQAFDPETQAWSSVPSPSEEIGHGASVKSLALEGKFYLFGNIKSKCQVYDPKKGRWTSLGFNPDWFNPDCRFYSRYCVIENVLFYWSLGNFFWHDAKVNAWRRLIDVEGFPYFCHRGSCKLVESSGKMVVLWDKCDGEQDNMICCAEISLERRKEDGYDEIFGKVEWLDVVLTVPKSWNLLITDALSAIV